MAVNRFNKVMFGSNWLVIYSR